ncbi:MAG TPA: hypothetical protein VK978_01240 [Candidatus Saccharimonadales bacterium]|nr:hypothetical protein [Candidatus Saccharimonadales bacterium]
MDDVLLKQLIRQLKILNIWITIVGGLILVSVIVIAILLFKVFTFVADTKNSVTSLQQKTEDSLNVKKQICENDSFGSFLNNKSEICTN